MSSSNDSKPDNYQVNAKICRLVEKFPCMYDRNHPQYLKKHVVEKAWIKIAIEMDDTMHSCKERWRNIRTSFARSINVNKVPASANRTKPYYLHDELQFLARHITPGIPKSRRSNVYYSAGEDSEMVEVSVGEESFDGFATIGQYEEDSQGQESSVDEENEGEEERKRELVQQKQHASPASIVDESETKLLRTTPTSKPKKRQRNVKAAVTNTEHDCDMKPTELLTNADFDETFLQGLLPEMKAMDFHQKIAFKRRIYEVIGEIFDSASQASVSANNLPSHSVSLPTTTTPTMTVVNAADLATIRRLNSFLYSNPTTVPAVPINFSSIPSTECKTTPATATVTLHRGALTRSSTNLFRVRMVNPPASALIKQEPLVVED